MVLGSWTAKEKTTPAHGPQGSIIKASLQKMQRKSSRDKLREATNYKSDFIKLSNNICSWEAVTKILKVASQVWWHTPLIPALRRPTQGLSRSLRPA
nr:unnamed protein product [Mus musculus]